MSCSDCAIVIELRRQLGEARAELAEWERLGAHGDAGEAEDSRVALIRSRLGIGLVQARFLLLIMDRPGRLLAKTFATEVLELENHCSSILSVHLCWIRKAMRATGAPGSIETVGWQGWRMAPGDVATLRTWLVGSEEAAPKIMTGRRRGECLEATA